MNNWLKPIGTLFAGLVLEIGEGLPAAPYRQHVHTGTNCAGWMVVYVLTICDVYWRYAHNIYSCM